MKLHRSARLWINRGLRLSERFGLRKLYTPKDFDLDALMTLNRCFTPIQLPEYGLAARRQRARSRLAFLRHFVELQGISLLDVGVGQGEMVWAASEEAARAVGIDFESQGLLDATKERDWWAIPRSLPSFAQADASHLPFENRTMDIVVSYWSFEHFADCRQVLSEMNRVLRPGGLIYLEFGPLFHSSLGSHLYRFLHIPWVHLLFDSNVIFAYLRQIHQEAWIDVYLQLNRLTISGFRDLISDSQMHVRHMNCRREPLGRFQRLYHSRLCQYSKEDLQTTSVTCVLQRPI
jgi:ubiquinone/menaquinone biosynthesis C-methylase UbiE